MADVRGRHGDHDPELVAALIDGAIDKPDDDRAAGRWVDTCADCATLYADLLALSVATRALPAPERLRDFQLTAADAARLATSARTPVWEPSPATPRLTRVMTDTRDHASHDTLLVSALADRSLAERDRTVAEALVATCGLCATLHADLVAVTAATRDLRTPVRVRDYRLSPDDAVRLRPNGWQRLIAAFGSPRDAFSRPLAMGLTTLGLVGLLAASIPSILNQAADVPQTSAELRAVGQEVGSAAPPSGAQVSPVTAAAASDAAAARQSQGPDAASEPTIEMNGGGAGERLDVTYGIDGTDDLFVKTEDGAGDPDPAGLAPDPSGLSAIVVVSGTLLIVGLGLFALRWSARRFGD